MARQAIQITLSKEERNLLLENTRPSTQQRYVQRARIILLAAEGLNNNEIARKAGTTFVSVCKWRGRYAKHGIVGLKDASGRGRKRRLTHDQVLKIAQVACQAPVNSTHWSLRRLSEKLKFVGKSQLQEYLHGFDLKPHQSRMWCFSEDPEFEKKKADVVGLYLRPPSNSFVICIDEKPCIQAIRRRIRPMLPGSPEQINHEYVRNGTVDLFAAFRVNDGKVIGRIEQRHRGIEFLAFVKDVYRHWGHGKKKLHIVLDNLGTHDVEIVQEWLGRHKNVEFHFTPTHASWLNQVELWFGILQRQALTRGSFESQEDLGKKILEYIDDYNQNSKPFAWTYGDPLKA